MYKLALFLTSAAVASALAFAAIFNPPAATGGAIALAVLLYLNY